MYMQVKRIFIALHLRNDNYIRKKVWSFQRKWRNEPKLVSCDNNITHKTIPAIGCLQAMLLHTPTPQCVDSSVHTLYRTFQLSKASQTGS